jgi:hypothetical protein
MWRVCDIKKGKFVRAQKAHEKKPTPHMQRGPINIKAMTKQKLLANQQANSFA